MQRFLMCLTFVLCGFCGSFNAPRPAQAAVSNEELREALFSLIHSVSSLENKLDRHEMRERALGDLIKKSLVNLQKGQNLFGQMKTTIGRLEERVGQVESLAVAEEERSIIQHNKLADALEAIYKFMNENNNNNKYIVAKEDSDEEENLPKKIDDLVESVKELRREIAELKADRETSDTESKALIQKSSQVIKDTLKSADEMVLKLDEKLSSLYVTSPNANGGGSDWERLVTDALSDIRTKVNHMSPGGDSDSSSNRTIDAIQDMRLEVLTAVDKNLIKISSRIQESAKTIEGVVNEVSKNLGESLDSLEQKQGAIVDTQNQILPSVENIKKIDSMLLETADNVFDTKRKVELNVHRILMDVSETVNKANQQLNSTLMDRLSQLDETILNNHLGSLTNLSSKIETEMSQVWRQIGIMYQEISSSKTALDRLQKQTEAYVNGTINTMDSMEGKVSLITTRMTEVDENLNYLLGRLSLVTQEFNQIKVGLGDALDNIRTSFQTVQNKVKEQGPGPHPIPPEPNDDDNHLIKKRLVGRFNARV